ncbi:MAG: alpha/beta hydrolase [Anaerolineaceae bacterium]|nr:alpha/beta hydrolase [Anaerolineaceae bacterium]
MKTIFIIIFVLFALVLAASWFLAGFVMSGKRQSPDEAMKWQSEHYDTSFYDSLIKTKYTIDGYDGYTLHAELLENPGKSEKYMILSHGYTDNRFGSLKYVQMYLDLGYNCIIYDLRGHGENKPSFTTYGILEGRDLARLVEDTRKRYPDMISLGLHGESLGAATTVSSLKYIPEVDFAIADCGFSDIDNVLREGYKNANAPLFLVDLADLGSRLRYRFSLKDMRPIDSLDQNEIPILFIHGADDNFILPKNSQDMFERTKGIREIHLIPGASHAESILTAPDDYKQIVEAFLKRIQ